MERANTTFNKHTTSSAQDEEKREGQVANGISVDKREQENVSLARGAVMEYCKS